MIGTDGFIEMLIETAVQSALVQTKLDQVENALVELIKERDKLQRDLIDRKERITSSVERWVDLQKEQ